MKEELQSALAELIQKTLQGVDTTKEFLTAEIPDVVNQLLMWHGVYSFVLFSIGIIFIAVLVYGNYRQCKWVIKECKEDSGWADDKPYLLFNLLQMFLIVIPLKVINLICFKFGLPQRYG